MRLKEHLITTNVPGVGLRGLGGGGLRVVEGKGRTDVVDSSNEWYLITYWGYLKRVDVASKKIMVE